MNYAVIDVGSNSIRLCIYEYKNEKLREIINKKEMAGLAAYKVNGKMSEQGIEKTCEILLNYKKILETIKVEGIFAFATASFRNITNSEEAVEIVYQKTGLTLDVLSGQEEAKLDFLGAKYDLEITDGLMVDIGGGSTELVAYKNGEMVECYSISVGSLSLFSTFVTDVLPSKRQRKCIEGYIDELLDDIDFINNFKYHTILGIGGTIRLAHKLCNIKYQTNFKHIETNKLEEMLQYMKNNRKLATGLILKIAPDRVHTVVPGIVILRQIIKRTYTKEVIISKHGVREGYLLKKLDNK